METNNLIKINNLTKLYSNTVALSNVNLELPKGKIIGLLGPNGSGKTTLIKIITNLLSQYQGEVYIDGQKPGVYTKSIISYLPDVNYLDEKWNGNQAIDFFKDFYQDFDENKARSLLNKLEIPVNKRFKELSKGTKEKLQLILVLSRNAKLYIFDEPIAGVDPATRDLIFDLILENYKNEYGITSNMYVKVDSLHTMVGNEKKGQEAVINTSCYYNVEARLADNAKPIMTNKIFIVPDIPVNAKNMLEAGYQLLKDFFIKQGLTVVDDMNSYEEQKQTA